MENGVIFIDIEKQMLTADGILNLKIQTSIPPGELLALYGSSGAGKTTLLRMLAGLTSPDRGIVKFGDTVWYDSVKRINLNPQFRNLSLMFQDYALFPNMTVMQNIRFAQTENDEPYVKQLLEMFGLSELRNRKPAGLSGGQKQRVALARALARKPQVLLLDEPLSALDAKMRQSLQNEIAKAHSLLNVTTILVSHDLNEIFRLATRVLCLENGIIAGKGTPDEVFLDHAFSGKVQITGQIARIDKNDTSYIVTVISGNSQIIKVISFESDLNNLSVGDQVMVFSKAFNPNICKMG